VQKYDFFKKFKQNKNQYFPSGSLFFVLMFIFLQRHGKGFPGQGNAVHLGLGNMLEVIINIGFRNG